MARKLTDFHMAFALFRWSVIFEGIAARAKAGNAASEGAGDTAGLAEAFRRAGGGLHLSDQASAFRTKALTSAA